MINSKIILLQQAWQQQFKNAFLEKYVSRSNTFENPNQPAVAEKKVISLLFGRKLL